AYQEKILKLMPELISTNTNLYEQTETLKEQIKIKTVKTSKQNFMATVTTQFPKNKELALKLTNQYLNQELLNQIIRVYFLSSIKQQQTYFQKQLQQIEQQKNILKKQFESKAPINQKKNTIYLLSQLEVLERKSIPLQEKISKLTIEQQDSLIAIKPLNLAVKAKPIGKPASLIIAFFGIGGLFLAVFLVFMLEMVKSIKARHNEESLGAKQKN
ncbi:MAG: hypothetical protein ACI86H_002680, partial [bacterium]